MEQSRCKYWIRSTSSLTKVTHCSTRSNIQKPALGLGSPQNRDYLFREQLHRPDSTVRPTINTIWPTPQQARYCAMICSSSFRARCSANRSGDPIVPQKRPDLYAIDDAELEAGIEMAHRSLIEVDDATGR
jgi:hypothetical protein